MESATENNRFLLYEHKVRVKTCGKSARANAAMYSWGKPYLEQDKAARSGIRSGQTCGYVAKIDGCNHCSSRTRIQNPAYSAPPAYTPHDIPYTHDV